MKNYNNLLLLVLCVLLAQSGDAIARCGKSYAKMDAFRLINKIATEWHITDPVHKDLLYAATQLYSPVIMSYKSDPYLWGNPYPSNVLRAAKDIACEIQGEDSEVYRILEQMLSYK